MAEYIRPGVSIIRPGSDIDFRRTWENLKVNYFTPGPEIGKSSNQLGLAGA
jgi:hypothetical protein